MDVGMFLERIGNLPRFAGRMRHVEVLAERAGEFADPSPPLPGPLRGLLGGAGIERLYTHQVDALEAARRGRDLVVVTGTASGKTLCYHVPILEAVLSAAESRALYLFPTKALAQDQLRGLEGWIGPGGSREVGIVAGVYDGDTPTTMRRRIRGEAHLVLSNPDMLHASILPHHPKWAALLSGLKFVVLDEVHTYRGILGAHVACVLRRLLRLCEHYGSRPVFLATSATIANPGELVERLIGRPVEVIDRDGSPRGRKYFALWNPAADGESFASAADDAVELLIEALLDGGQTLAFTRTRQAAELIHRYAREGLAARRSPLADQIRAYRGGYLPNERREIEKELFDGKLRGVAATNALELGIDIGSLDVALLVHYPGTIASTWQQAGRSGRRHAESLAVLLAGSDPVDQYLLRHPGYFFSQSPERAVVDPHNPYVMARHLKAAAFELPLSHEELDQFGPVARPIAELLHDEGHLTEIGEAFYFSGDQNPALGVSLRHMSDNTFSIVLVEPEAAVASPRRRSVRSGPPCDESYRVLANVDAISAPELVYPEAVYLHDGETYLVRTLDLDGKVAYVERRETDYYTQAVLESSVKINGRRRSSHRLGDSLLEFGDVDVTWKTVAFKKIRFATRENIGMGPVDIPSQNLPTTAFWLAPGAGIRAAMRHSGLRLSDGLVGLRNLFVVAVPMVAMCDSRDLGGVVDSRNLGQSAVIVYDRYPGGLGYSEQAMESISELLEICREMVMLCPCEDGCPSCVGLPNLRPAIHSDPDLARGYPIPDKRATIELIGLISAAADRHPELESVRE